MSEHGTDFQTRENEGERRQRRRFERRGRERGYLMPDRAISAADLAHYRLPAMRERIGESRRLLEQALERGRVGVSFSGGKDCTVVAGLLRTLYPSAPLGFFDSGCDYPETYETIRVWGARTITPQRYLIDMLREMGEWGYRGPAYTGTIYDCHAYLFLEPDRQFTVAEGLAVTCWGLRAQESRTRRLYRDIHGPYHYSATREVTVCNPIMDWREKDVWAYIAGAGLPYNRIYDRYAALGLPRRAWRVSSILNTGGADRGKFAVLRQLHPDLFHALSAEFPEIRRMT